MQGRKRPMPVGIEDFKKLVQGEYYFVDKTRFIRDLLDIRTNVTLITRPRRFGKTLALSMLQYFFTMEDAEENRKLFEGLDIEMAGEAYMREQGSRPVVFLTLKEVQAGTFDEAGILLAEILRKLYEKFVYLEHSTAISPQERQYFSEILNATCDRSKMRFALSNLMEALEKHHQKKPILLLDEYDAPILSAWENGYYKECIDFMRGFLGSALKTNPALGFAVLTGVTRVSKESIFSGLNNLKVCSVLSDSYCDIFGFTQEEAEKLMEECGAAGKIPELRQWYDGYRFGWAEIYNPWSVIRYIDEGCKFRPYWLNTSGNSILKDLLERVDERRKRELEGLMRGQAVEAPVLENLVYGDIHSNRDMLFMMLMTAGYLKPVEVWQDEEYMEWAKLQIPNVEIRTAYRREILNHIVPSQGGVLLRDMMKSMASGDVAGFSEVLSEILRDFVSYHDIAQPETFRQGVSDSHDAEASVRCLYHGLMLGFSVLMEGEYRVESNREHQGVSDSHADKSAVRCLSGYGRFDIAFFPLKENTPGVILELKSAKSEEELEQQAGAVLRQIEGKEYIAEFSRQGVKEVWKYGISFHGKRVSMERG